MKTACGNCSCNQGRACPLSERAVRSRINNFIIGSVLAVLIVAALGWTQVLDADDAQTAAGQVMACSQYPVECAEFERSKHATATQNRRQ